MSFEVITDALTGEQTIRPYTPEEIAAFEAAAAAALAASVPAYITRRQCSLQLLAAGMITGQEAIDMARSGIPPAAIQSLLDQLPEPDRTVAVINFAADHYYRANELLAQIATLNNLPSEWIDQFFISASEL